MLNNLILCLCRHSNNSNLYHSRNYLIFKILNLCLSLFCHMAIVNNYPHTIIFQLYNNHNNSLIVHKHKCQLKLLCHNFLNLFKMDNNFLGILIICHIHTLGSPHIIHITHPRSLIMLNHKLIIKTNNRRCLLLSSL